MLDEIDSNSAVPLATQIHNVIRVGIASGKLQEGQQLPSVRELWERYRLDPLEIAKAYRDLENMAYIHARSGVGIFISERAKVRCQQGEHSK